jgi:hypothetical protein
MGANMLGDMPSDRPWEKEKYQSILQAAQSAIARGRYVFGVVNLAAVLVLTAEFAATFPWIENTLNRAKQLARVQQGSDPASAKANLVLIDRIKDTLWHDVYTVSFPLLSVKFNVADLSVIGSAGMAVLAVWLYYAIRRENHIVGRVIREMDAALQENALTKAIYLYHGVAHYFVFMTVTEQDSPTGGSRRNLARIAIRVLLYSPAWIPVLVLVDDIVSLFQPPRLSGEMETTLLATMGSGETLEFVLRALFCIAMSTFAWIQCRDSVRFSDETMSALDKVRSRVEATSPGALQ